MRLLPTQSWEYTFQDAFRGLYAAVLCNRPAGLDPLPLPGLPSCLPIAAGRLGIVLALQALGLQPGARIGVPLYCCPVVLKAIVSRRCIARFIDVDSHTLCLSPSDLKAKRLDLDAVLAVHMFGNVCDVRLLRDLAPGKPIIEDCAQAIGSRLDGRPVGSFGDVAVFSFRSGKYVSVGEGGAISSPLADISFRLRELSRHLPKPDRVTEFAHVIGTYIRSLLRRRPLWGLLGERLWSTYTSTVAYSSQSSIAYRAMFFADYLTFLRRLPLLEAWIGRQRFNADFYTKSITLDQDMLCSERAGTFYNRLQFPLLMRTPAQCGWMAAALRRQGISTARPYKDIAAIAAAHYGYKGDCPQAESVAQRVLVIPCNHSLRPEDVAHVARSVNAAWTNIGRRSSAVPAIGGTTEKLSVGSA